MPNWVNNILTVSGNKEDLDKFVEQVGASYTRSYARIIHEEGTFRTETHEATWEGDFSFWNITKPSDDILDEYHTVADGKAPANNWYPWNIDNWGTKWDADVSYLEREEDGSWRVHFATAWSPPYPVIAAAAEQYPTLHFFLEWEEEQGFGAEVVFTAEDGVNEIRTWDIPESHADYANRDNEDGCFCNLEDPEYWFDDCPGKKEALEDDAGILEDLVELAG